MDIIQLNKIRIILLIYSMDINNHINVHPDIQERLTQYISNGILNTIFYGQPGVGKHTLILNMFKSLNQNLKEKEKIQFWEESCVRIYSTSTYIRFDAKECVRKKANLPKIIEEISRTRDISADSNKIIYIRYINYLGAQQEAFRQLVEDTHLTCRYVFTCRNIDTIDPALNSRCLLIRVPSPSVNSLIEFTNKYSIHRLTESETKKIISYSDKNINTLKHIIMLSNKMSKVDNYEMYNILYKMVNDIITEISSTTKLATIQTLAEKYHYSELNILDLCKHMPHIHFFITHLQKYSSYQTPSLYDTSVLFLQISKIFNKNINISEK